MVDYSWPRVKHENIVKNHIYIYIYILFSWTFILIQGFQGAIPEGPEPIPEVKNIKNMKIFKNLQIKITTRRGGSPEPQSWNTKRGCTFYPNECS